MRILVLNYEFPPVGGGGGRFAEDLCRHLSARGHEIRVQTAHFRGLPRVEARDGYTIYRGRTWRRQAHTCTVGEMAAFLVTNLLPAWRHALTWRPHIIQAHFAVPTGVLAWFLKQVTGIPYVLSAQLGDVPGGVPEQTDHLFRWLKPFTVPIWKGAAAVTVPGEHIRRLAQRAYGVSPEVIPNGVDLEGVKQSPLRPHQPPRLVFAGRFNPQKNLLFLVEVLKQVADLPWELDLLGDGPQRAALEEKVHQAELGARIKFHGWVTPEMVETCMSRADILVLPSSSEGLPVVGVRALAAGLAVLGSEVGGITDLVEPGSNGYLCPVNDVGAFAGALRRMLTAKTRLRQMKGASRKLAAKFDLGAIAQRFEELFVQSSKISLAKTPRRKG